MGFRDDSGVILDLRQGLYIKSLEVQGLTPRDEPLPPRRLYAKTQTLAAKKPAPELGTRKGHAVWHGYPVPRRHGRAKSLPPFIVASSA